jgi:signal transduction histidine kinase
MRQTDQPQSPDCDGIHARVAEPGPVHRNVTLSSCSRPEIRIASDLLPVQADARLILRVLHNLIANAYKHAGKQAHMELVAEPIEGAVLFAVDDDGPGIPILERETIFERFIQGEQTIKRDGAPHGAGLGLAFCKLVVEQLGGHIWADASRIGGARIAFTLPLAPAAQVIRGANEDQSLPTPRVA